jgi:hypothetical protein
VRRTEDVTTRARLGSYTQPQVVPGRRDPRLRTLGAISRRSTYYSDMRAKQGKRANGKPRATAVVDPSAPVSPTARKALAAFRVGVRKELASLARRGIPTAATVNGKRVIGVPKKVGNRYVLVPVNQHDENGRAAPKRSANRARSR